LTVTRGEGVYGSDSVLRSIHIAGLSWKMSPWCGKCVVCGASYLVDHKEECSPQ
jgi:hypothetical protein